MRRYDWNFPCFYVSCCSIVYLSSSHSCWLLASIFIFMSNRNLIDGAQQEFYSWFYTIAADFLSFFIVYCGIEKYIIQKKSLKCWFFCDCALKACHCEKLLSRCRFAVCKRWIKKRKMFKVKKKLSLSSHSRVLIASVNVIRLRIYLNFINFKCIDSLKNNFI